MLSFPEIVLQRALLEPERVACRFFKGAALAEETLTFASLWERSADIAQYLQANGLSQQRALLVCESQKNFVVAFYACLLAGVVAVPVSPPKRQVSYGRLELVAKDSKPLAVIFDTDVLRNAELLSDAGAELMKVDVRACAGANPAPRGANWTPIVPHESTPAFLQYASGSTGDPKGVVVTHGNLVSNCAAIQDGMQITSESRVFTALPLFHDMGLVGGAMQLMYSGCPAGFLSPAEFVRYPERWLQIVSESRISISGGPNFMYDLAARTIQPEAIQGLDLSSWRVAFCGAEPIRAAVVKRFTERFAACGFRAEAFYPCYGMAESTLLITGSRVGSMPSVQRHEESEVVGCGVPWGDTRVEIVDPETSTAVREGDVGEIWVRGRSVAKGYWRRPELTRQVFEARIADENGEKYLRTGDMGFMRNGQLYVTGRLKDLIIVHAKKYAPQDIEETCEQSHAALRQGGGGAFGLSDEHGERLVVVLELKREWLRRHLEWPNVIRSVRTAVSLEYGLPLREVVLIKTGNAAAYLERQAAASTMPGGLRRGNTRGRARASRRGQSRAARAKRDDSLRVAPTRTGKKS